MTEDSNKPYKATPLKCFSLLFQHAGDISISFLTWLILAIAGKALVRYFSEPDALNPDYYFFPYGGMFFEDRVKIFAGIESLHISPIAWIGNTILLVAIGLFAADILRILNNVRKIDIRAYLIIPAFLVGTCTLIDLSTYGVRALTNMNVRTHSRFVDVQFQPVGNSAIPYRAPHTPPSAESIRRDVTAMGQKIARDDYKFPKPVSPIMALILASEDTTPMSASLLIPEEFRPSSTFSTSVLLAAPQYITFFMSLWLMPLFSYLFNPAGRKHPLFRKEVLYSFGLLYFLYLYPLRIIYSVVSAIIVRSQEKLTDHIAFLLDALSNSAHWMIVIMMFCCTAVALSKGEKEALNES